MASDSEPLKFLKGSRDPDRRLQGKFSLLGPGEKCLAFYGKDRRMDVHVDTQSQPCPRATGCGHCPGTCDGGLAR